MSRSINKSYHRYSVRLCLDSFDWSSCYSFLNYPSVTTHRWSEEKNKQINFGVEKANENQTQPHWLRIWFSIRQSNAKILTNASNLKYSNTYFNNMFTRFALICLKREMKMFSFVWKKMKTYQLLNAHRCLQAALHQNAWSPDERSAHTMFKIMSADPPAEIMCETPRIVCIWKFEYDFGCKIKIYYQFQFANFFCDIFFYSK